MPEYAFPSGIPLHAGSWSVGSWLTPLCVFVLLVAIVMGGIIVSRKVDRSKLIVGAMVVVTILLGLCLLLPAIDPAREARLRIQCKNNLKQISLGMFNYEAAHREFPVAGVQDRDSGADHSWRVSIVPFIDGASDFFKYRFDEPWNSEHNAAFQETMPRFYQCPVHPVEKSLTAYAMLTGPETFGSDGATGLKLDDILDGLSDTIMIVEACGREIVWSEPRDVEVTDQSLGVNLPGNNPGRSRGIISSYHPGGAHVLFADGTVRFVNEKIDTNVLKALTTISGNEILPENW